MSRGLGKLLLQPATVAGALTMAALLGLVLFIQAQRHSWPFIAQHASPAVGNTSAVPAAARADSHPRVAVDLDPTLQTAAGLRVETARRESIAPTLRAVATVVPDERLIWHAHTRVAGWIEQLHIATVGEAVVAGQALAAIFSQDLYASQLEYLAALAQAERGPRSAVVEGSRARLQVLGMTEAEIAAIEHSRQARRLVTISASRDGVVLRRGVSVGTAVDPSTPLLTAADLSTVWVLAEVPESRAAGIQPGMSAQLDVSGSGLPPFEATVEFVYPTLSERTRTLRIRFAVPNPDGVLRPGMYGAALLRGAPHEALTVPRNAVVDSGKSQHVFVAMADGRFEPRAVTLGLHLGERIEILDGLADDESIVVAGVFLLDSESRLRSGASAGHAGHGMPDSNKDTDPHERH